MQLCNAANGSGVNTLWGMDPTSEMGPAKEATPGGNCKRTDRPYNKCHNKTNKYMNKRDQHLKCFLSNRKCY